MLRKALNMFAIDTAFFGTLRGIDLRTSALSRANLTAAAPNYIKLPVNVIAMVLD